MYGGVATPLALLHHGDVTNRPTKHTMPSRSNSRDESYGGARNPLRLPPLRETGPRDHINNGCENEPLLPNVTGKGKAILELYFQLEEHYFK